MSGEPIQSHPTLPFELSRPVVQDARSAFARTRRRPRPTIVRLPTFPLFPLSLDLASRVQNLDDLLIAAAYQIQMTVAAASPFGETN
jgi:hypothetical protein